MAATALVFELELRTYSLKDFRIIPNLRVSDLLDRNGIFEPIKTQQEMLSDETWAVRVTRLMELLSIKIRAVQRHIEAESPPLIIEQYEQYEKLRDRRLAELTDLMRGRGLTFQLDSGRRKAA